MIMKKKASLLLAVLMVFSLCACGSGSMASSEMTGSSYEAADYDTAAYNMSLSAEASSESSGFGNGVSRALDDSTDSAETSSDTDIDPEKIIYSADVTVETTEFEKTLDSVSALISGSGGFIESSSISDDSYMSKACGYSSGRYASYTLRIPGTCFNDVMSSLSNLGNIPYSYTYTQNVTSQYYDVQARLEAYGAQEQRLIELMEQAYDIDDIISIEDRLTEVRYTIDSLQSQLNDYDRRVSYSTIYLSIEEVEEYTPAASLSFGEKLVNAFNSGLDAVGSFFRNLVLILAEALPAIMLLAVIAVIIVVIVRRSNAARRKKQARMQRAVNASRETMPAAQPGNTEKDKTDRL